MDEVGPMIPDQWIEKLVKTNHVIGVSFRNNALSPNGVRMLGQMTELESLRLGGPMQITDEDLKHLHRLKNLKSLSIISGRFTEASLAELRMALPDCEVIGH
jgi:hypothetical protein